MTAQRYSSSAIFLHWALALLLAFQLSLGWTLDGPGTPALFARFQLHKSIGILILVLSVARLAIRLTVKRPAPLPGPAWAHRLADLVHWLFYLVMIGTPITGWVLVSTAKVKVPTLLFGVIPLPHLPFSAAANAPATAAHSLLALLGVLLFLMHVAGALRHQWLLGKPEVQRMIPFAQGRAVNAVLGALALIAGAFALAWIAHPDRPATPVPVAGADNAMVDQIAPDADNGLNATPANATSAMNEATPPAAENAAASDTETAAQPLADWAIAPGGSLGFTAQWNAQPVKGHFSKWTAQIHFSPDDLDKSTIRVAIDLTSADTGDGQRDDTLKGSDFFDTAAHPGAVFTSRTIRHLSGDRYEVAGALNLHGVAKPTTLRFTLKIAGDKASVSGTGRIDRTSFGVGSGEWASTDAIAGSVDIDFAFSATRR